MGDVVFQELELRGSYTATWPVNSDTRGSLTKIYAEEAFSQLSPGSRTREIFYTSSSQGVLRGMHLQHASFDQWKIVTVLSGRVLDVLLDLRPASDSFGRSFALTLQEGSGLSVVVPPGVAHGYFVESSSATTVYAVSSEYEASKEIGVRFDSFGFDWPDSKPTLSARDELLPTLSAYARENQRPQN
jgi:dTDP-4-dehydrorhamnose 3,5-epimerase